MKTFRQVYKKLNSLPFLKNQGDGWDYSLLTNPSSTFIARHGWEITVKPSSEDELYQFQQCLHTLPLIWETENKQALKEHGKGQTLEITETTYRGATNSDFTLDVVTREDLVENTITFEIDLFQRNRRR